MLSLWMIPKSTSKLIDKGETTGIFQLSGHASGRVIEDMEVKEFEDIVAIMALARPGPAKSGMTAEFLDRKRGKRWKKKHPIYEGISRDTYGILIYQEQITQVISQVADMKASDADRIRKIISKKRDPRLFAKYRREFIKGSSIVNKTLTRQQAEKFWEGLQEWADYGFNRSHSVGYALIAYWTAWLKAYHPSEFYCAHLTYGDFHKDSLDKNKQRVIDEAMEKGFKIMPPKVGKSDPARWIAEGKTLYVPFTEIKGVGEAKLKQHFNKKKKKAAPRGFFDIPNAKEDMTQVNKALEEIGANDKDSIPDDIDKYFEFSFGGGDAYSVYPNLMDLLGYSCDMKTLKKVLSLNVESGDGWIPDNVIQRKRYHVKKVAECKRCELARECISPVPTSAGIYNAFITGEA
jgi:DNA polymerase-3 subunit alpha